MTAKSTRKTVLPVDTSHDGPAASIAGISRPSRQNPTEMITNTITHRSQKMNLINEDLARAHIHERQREAEEARLAYGLLKLRKASRKAAAARLAAKRALEGVHLSL